MKKFIFLIVLVFGVQVFAEWDIDFSRRYDDLVGKEKRMPTSYEEKSNNFLDILLDKQAPIQEFVIVNSENGFIPARVNLKKGYRYKVHVVNVNKKHKNVSFMLDDFSEHHGTYYGEVISFEINSAKEGLYAFHCPETAKKGQFVVYDAKVEPDPPVSVRQPASMDQ